MTLDIEELVLPKLRPIIENQDFKDFPSSFIYPKKIEKGSILFIGINPSSTDEPVQLDSYELKQEGNNHQYFKRFEEISNYCQTSWTHLDLLFFRETSQFTINDILRKENGVNYIWQQLQIADYLIKESRSKIIVVSNALARTFLGLDRQGDKNIWLGYEFKFDYDIGTYRWNNIPIFFSSMLTGRRALDNGSYERLKWQIRRTLIILTKKEIEKIQIEKAIAISEGEYAQAAMWRDHEKLTIDRLNKLEFPLEQ